MDTLKTALLWPPHAVLSLLSSVAGWTVLLLPCTLRLLTKGSKSFSNNLDIFAFMSMFPFGKRCFSSLIPLFAPYSGSIEGHINDLGRQGDVISCSGTIENYPWLRNPFQSVHAVALTNLGELVSGICMLTAFQCLGGKYRGIPVKISTDYFKKIKGTVFASSSIDMKKLVPGSEVIVSTVLKNKAGEEVAKCDITWTISAKSDKKSR